MKLLMFFYHFFISNIFSMILIFLAFDGASRFFALGLWILGWAVSYTYIDKIILYFLGAREIIDSDFQELFQQLKSETYKNFERQPKVYLYSGHSLKCFVFDSRNEWSIVLDRGLAEKMNSEQVKALADYLVRYKKTNVSWRLTKSLGLVIFIVGLIYSFWSRIFMLNPKGKSFKILAFFSLALFKPFFDAILLTGKKNVALECHESLEPIINISREMKPSFDYSQFLFDHIQDSVNLKDLMVKYLESFPVIERGLVKRSY